MADRRRTYRKKPLAVFEAGTRIYAPSRGEPRYRVVATDAEGNRVFHKAASESDARARAREIEAHLASAVPLGPTPSGPRTVGALAEAYLSSLAGRSRRYRERQDSILRIWVLPHLGDVAVTAWTPADSEALLNAARSRLAPATVQNLGSCLRSLVTVADKSRWLGREVDPMWRVSYSSKAEHQGQVNGLIPRDALPNDKQCEALFEAFTQLGEPAWAMGMRLASRSGLRWGELIALRPCDIDFAPHRVVRVHRAVEQSRQGLAFKAPKNAQKRTTIFPASMAGGLAAHVAVVRATGGDEALLFDGRNGEPPERRQFSRLWHRAARAAVWPMRSATASLWHPHDLRHVAACWMLFDVGLDPALVAQMLGHANAAFTLSRYVGVRTGAHATANELTDRW
jgi:integrase